MTPDAERKFDAQAGAWLWVALLTFLLVVAGCMAAVAEWV